ncbi:triphosphoribosyl-dephospho-CoA synthase [Benzoatithermus flavus]|uniref:Triphosphoribosyl-dephospho-CoA synthase n=1 Tax=Benzoatithermus flavus TaxID=3108223 RepID=A0ABU8XPB8_9PROT
MTRIRPGEIAAAFVAACRAELEALKPGNVHVHADGHGMTVMDFVRSAEVSAPFIADPGSGIGARVLAAVEATRAACGQNTNLGILLLAAPLAAAAQAGGSLPDALARLLAGLDVADAASAYRAIRLASPGGLGRSEHHDVAAEPVVTLLEAMRTAAGKDRIARQYVTGFADVLTLGLPRLRMARAAGWPEPWAVTATFMVFLARFPDTHIVRKHGPDVAEKVRATAAGLDPLLLAADDPTALQPLLLALDGELKRAGINPGTSADLAVASCFADLLVGLAETGPMPGDPPTRR